MAQVYCSTCEAPIIAGTFTNDNDNHEEWLTEAVLLTTAHQVENGTIELDEYFPQTRGPGPLSDDPPGPEYYHLGSKPPAEASRSVIRLEAYTAGGNACFHIPSTGENVMVYKVKHVKESIPMLSRGGPLYIPLHKVCMQICDRFIAFTKASASQKWSPPTDGITSLKSLWEVLCRRVPGSIVGSNISEIDEPHCYYGGSLSRSRDWRGNFDDDESAMLEINPAVIPDLTDAILQNLELLESPPITDIIEPNTSSSINPPEESRLEPGSYHSLQDLDLTCDHTHSQAWWCELLIDKETFPWLWDLNNDQTRSK